jgi:hypothetical protein
MAIEPLELEKKELDDELELGAKIRRVRRKRKTCAFCLEKKPIDYKDVARLRRYISERGKILPADRPAHAPSASVNWRSPSSGRANWHCSPTSPSKTQG